MNPSPWQPCCDALPEPGLLVLALYDEHHAQTARIDPEGEWEVYLGDDQWEAAPCPALWAPIAPVPERVCSQGGELVDFVEYVCSCGRSGGVAL